MDGWIKLQRSIKDHWIWDDPIKLKWWIDLLITANHCTKKVNIGNQIFECGRGQSIQSLKTWADQWKVSRDKARHFLELLEKEGMITYESLGVSTRITICNYDEYQGEECFAQPIDQISREIRTGVAPKSAQTNSCISEDYKDSTHAKSLQSHLQVTSKSLQSHTNKNIKNDKNNNDIKKNIKETRFDYLKSDLSFIESEFRECFMDWLNYKKEQHNFSYKTEKACKTVYNELIEYSGHDARIAEKIVNRSIANGWKGLFPINGYKTSNNQSHKLEFETMKPNADSGFKSTI